MMQKSKDSGKDMIACRYPLAIKYGSEVDKILYAWTSSLRWLWNHNWAMIKWLRRRRHITLLYDGSYKLNLSTNKFEKIGDGTNKHLTRTRRKNPRQILLPYQIQQTILRNLNAALRRALFKDEVRAERNRRFAEAVTPKEKAKALEYGFPRFKRCGVDIVSIHFNYGTFHVTSQDGKCYIDLSKVEGKDKNGDVKRKKIRILTGGVDLPNDIKNANIMYDPLKRMWFVSLVYVANFVKKDFPKKDVVGLDVGISSTCYTSDSTDKKEYNIAKDMILRLEDKKRHLQRIEARKIKVPNPHNPDKPRNSKRCLKIRRKLNKIDRRISDIRSDFQHQMSKEITDIYPVIAGEDLQVSKMMASAGGTIKTRKECCPKNCS